jgi:hypothetical protein
MNEERLVPEWVDKAIKRDFRMRMRKRDNDRAWLFTTVIMVEVLAIWNLW